MSPESAQNAEVAEWLERAEQDLASARILVGHHPPVLSTACFHCQQAAEKLVKAFLVSRGRPFERVHNLTYLIDLCNQEGLPVAAWRDDAEALTPFAVRFRYPGEGIALDLEKANAALSAAEQVWEAIAVREFHHTARRRGRNADEPG